MIIDFISRTNNMNYNVKLAKLFGLYSSVFLGILIDCHFAKKDDYIKLSREDIYNISGIDEEKQKEVEDNLRGYKLIEINSVKNSSNKNYYKLNVDLLSQILTSNDERLQEELSKTFEAFEAATKPPRNVSKRSAIILNLKKSITIQDPESKNNMEEWIDAVMQKSGYLSKVAVEDMGDQLMKYSKNKVTLLRELTRLAAKVAYKDAKWVITKYEQDNLSNSNLRLNNLSQEEVDENINQLKNYKGETF